MNKLKKAMLILGMILFYANSAYATTEGTYVASDSNINVGKIMLFLIALGLVILVLFFSYSMDKNELQEKKKEQVIKNTTKKNSTNNNSRMYVSEKKDKEYIQSDEEYMKQYKKASEKTSILQPISYNFEKKLKDDSYEKKEEEFIVTYEMHKDNKIVESEAKEGNSTMVFDSAVVRNVEKKTEYKVITDKKRTTEKK